MPKQKRSDQVYFKPREKILLQYHIIHRPFLFLTTRLFYKQRFYKQHQVEIGKKIKQKLSNTIGIKN